MSRSRRLSRGLLATTLAAVIVLTLAACDEATSRLDSTDRNNFITASNEFASAFDDLSARATALEGPTDVPAFVEAADEDIATMQTQVGELDELAGEVDGDAKEVAEAATAAANDVVAATQAVVAALQASDDDALQLAIDEADAAIDAFNDQIDAWNAL